MGLKHASMPKKGKKGKGGADADAIERRERANEIKRECVQARIKKVGEFKRDYLDMSASGLGFVPDEVPSSPSLTRLVRVDLSRNQLFSSDHVFQSLEHITSLKILNLSHNFLNGPLTGRATDVTSLEELYLDHNQLTALPSDIGNWTSIRTLSVSKNELVEIPSSCSAWKKIETLNLRYNKLTALPTGALAEWASCKHLYVGANAITEVPETISSLTALEMLDLRKNQLERIPMQLSSCTKLKLLNLGDNKIGDIPADVLAKCVELEELHL